MVKWVGCQCRTSGKEGRPMPSRLRALCLLLVSGLLACGPLSAAPDARYWSLDEILDQIDTWRTQYPDLIHHDELGITTQGEPIPLLRLSDNAATSEAEPRLFIHAAQHANECNGTGAVMKLVDDLLADYGTDPVAKARLDELELYVAPVVNVDGHRYVFDGEPSWEDWRKTLRDNNGNEQVDFPDDGVDTNRNWDWRWEEYPESDPASQKYKGPYPFSEPEVAALRDFVLAERPLIVADLHSPVSITWHNYIFYMGMGGPEDEISRDVAEEWADRTRTENGGTYNTIYALDTLPKEQCWIYYRAGILSYLMEISAQCWWTGAMVDTIAHRVARGHLALLDRVRTGPGITGRVTDAATGDPLVAEVRIDELHSPDVGPRLTEARFGQYHRLTDSRDYTVRALCDGYDSQVRTVTVGAGWAVADFALEPDPAEVQPVEREGDLRLRASNPLRSGESLHLSLPVGAPAAAVDLYDPQGRRVATLGAGLEAGRVHLLPLPARLEAGIYLARARAGSAHHVLRLVLLP
ncbi:MAG: hypothetical protein GF346_09785 [Candidatus Eisenbacteria bacterium]|nr:hypothetical protein [Candidatus Latescibacterota bacterium]MBD3302724.1 hypothetical protein [Candidatus Eisenbacteria bacterium]